MKKTILSMAAFALCACMLFGCSKGAGTPAGGTGESSTSQQPAAAGETVTLKYDLTVSLEHPWGLAATEFKKRLEEKSGGRFKVEIYPSSTSGSEADSLAGMLVGTTSMTMSGGSFSGYAPSATLLEAPWAYNSEEDVKNMINSDIGTSIKNDFDNAGFHVLWYQLRGPRQLTSNVALNTPADLTGRKMRMSGNPLHNNMWNSAGAVCSSIALSETFNALSQGVVEMQENPYDMIYDNSFFEVQKYVNETSHVYSTILNLISADVYNGLDDEMKGWLNETSNEMQEWVDQYYFEHKDDYRQKCIDAGMTVNTDVDREAFKEAMLPPIKAYLEEQGADLWDMYQKISAMSDANEKKS
ncbi:TRAP transporter substrate-binding protein [Marasmitruncus massiliensis]|uniref:TRAP transporter substrate-binding protein n=1 Tax=Marasmitruncus massiliensis TaxID=1944642 RepID=UPI001FA8C0EC|nr:TRAP transporter substrate-binding protein [Marasmitruncus massiliensis]